MVVRLNSTSITTTATTTTTTTILLPLIQESFPKASPNTLASRKMVHTQGFTKKQQFAKHIHALNTSFHRWIHEQISSDPYIDLTDGFQDYIDHASSIEDRYLRSYGK
jgi:hypothetical protein